MRLIRATVDNERSGVSVIDSVNLTPNIEKVIVQHELSSEAAKVVSQMGMLEDIATNLARIKIVADTVPSFTDIVALKPKLDSVIGLSDTLNKVLDNVPNIQALELIKESIVKAANSAENITKVVSKTTEIEKVALASPEVVEVARIKDSVVNLDRVSTELNELHSNLDKIVVVYKNLLAIQVVANSVEWLKYYEANKGDILKLVDGEFNTNLKQALDNLDSLKSFATLATGFPELVKDSTAKLTQLKTDSLNEINELSELTLKKIDRAFLRWELELTKLQKEFAEFKLETKEKYDAKFASIEAEQQTIKDKILKIAESYAGHTIINNITETTTATNTSTYDIDKTISANKTENVTATNTATNTATYDVNKTTTNNVTENVTNTTTANVTQTSTKNETVTSNQSIMSNETNNTTNTVLAHTENKINKPVVMAVGDVDTSNGVDI